MQHVAKYRETPSALSPLRASPLPSASSTLFVRFLSFLRVFPFVVSVPPPFRPSPCHRPSNYAVVVTSCHVIKLHLFTMRPDCYQACNSRDSASVSHRRFQSVSSRSVPIVTFHWPFTCQRVHVPVHSPYSHNRTKGYLRLLREKFSHFPKVSD